MLSAGLLEASAYQSIDQDGGVHGPSAGSRHANDVDCGDLPLANDNPMRRLLTDLIDFDRLRSQKEIQLTVCATNARTARRRVFTDN
jgi:hypothetical protein